MTSRTRRRIETVAVAPAAALATWAVIRLIGIELAVSTGDGRVDALDVVAAALFGSLAGWLTAGLLESHSPRPRLLWSFLGSTALAASMIGPSWLEDGSSAVALMTLHLVTAVVVIAGFALTLPLRCAPLDHP